MVEFSTSRTLSVREAIVLAAGNGDRFENGSPHSKLLTPVGGTPLLTRTLESAFAAGIRDAHVVLGYDADSVRALAERSAPAGLRLHFHLNNEWRHENGLSVLAARDGINDHLFALMMGDHIFESAVLGRLIDTPVGAGEVLLGIDRQLHDAATEAEATKVRLDGEQIRDIGKTLDPYDALDTGLFVCDPTLFEALEASCAAGDSTLSGAVRRLADQDLVRAVDIGHARWCDVDTIADLAVAERLVRAPSDA
jgi:1L-myo-inositol 1-phosphate cytidylyltransferase / CDP-L-myo-inositol myo-inositolphosphotransferase